VRAVQWCADDAAVVTVGGRDCSLLQWAHAPVKEVSEPKLAVTEVCVTVE
jgi:hypothetical protein